jgi:hypothetical protein
MLAIGTTNYLLNAVPSTPYPISMFTPGNYLVCINGSLTISPLDDTVLTGYVIVDGGCIITSSSTISTSASVVNYIDESIIDTRISTTDTNYVPITCYKVITITSSQYSSIPSSYYVSAALSANIINNTFSTNATISCTIDSYSITRVG